MSHPGSQNPTDNIPRRTAAEVDWARRDAGANTGIPPRTPTVEAILERLPALDDGALVIDVACGTGQPTFALALARPQLHVLGIDVTAARIEQAQAIASANDVRNARFEVMSADRLELPDASVQGAVSQFGLLQEGDVAASVRELARVLEPGAPFSIAAHGDLTLNTRMSLITGVLSHYAPPDTLPDVAYLSRLAEPGLREGLLRDAGMRDLKSDEFRWSIPVPDFDALWGMASGPVPFGRAFDAIDPGEISAIKDELAHAAAAYLADGGGFDFPMACRLYWGRR